jgi:hypothetical protein
MGTDTLKRFEEFAANALGVILRAYNKFDAG